MGVSDMSFEHVQIATTFSTKKEAEAVAERLIAERLAACVQVQGPIASTYRWNGEVQRDEEWQCTVKTAAALTERVLEFIADAHPSDNPELSVVPIVDGSDEYLRWIKEEVEE